MAPGAASLALLAPFVILAVVSFRVGDGHRLALDLAATGTQEGRDEFGQSPGVPSDCYNYMISRRRDVGRMCACRRRHGSRGLPSGWHCGGERDTDEDAHEDEADKLEFNSEMVVTTSGEQGQDREDAVCCCGVGGCNPEDVFRGGFVVRPDPFAARVVHRNGWGSTVVAGLDMCCKMNRPSTVSSGQCPRRSRFFREMNESLCTLNVLPPNVEGCAKRIANWFRTPLWYTAVANGTNYQTRYQRYRPCGVTKDYHIDEVMIRKNWNAILALEELNPLRDAAVNFAECAGLRDAQYAEAVAESHTKLCPFYPPVEYYQPVMARTGVCFYNEVDASITLHPQRSCVEGYRCACPALRSVQTALETQPLMTQVSSALASAPQIVDIAPMISPYLWTGLTPFLEAAFLTQVTGAIATAATPVGAVVFGGAAVYSIMQQGCQEGVACFPMSCHYQEHMERPGCRLLPALDLQDRQNEYWFMPPPEHKCSFEYGFCSMRDCSREDMLRQAVGIFNETVSLGAVRHGRDGVSVVLNCQPLLFDHMDNRQKQIFEVQTRDLKVETQEYLATRTGHARTCPWMRPVPVNNLAECTDGHRCAAEADETCCESHGRVSRCPRNRPHLCVDRSCDSFEGACAGRCRNGNEDDCGVRECNAERMCPWLAAVPEDVEEDDLQCCGEEDNAMVCIQDYGRVRTSGWFHRVSQTCEDVPSWTDAQGYGCEVYASSSEWCEKYGDEFENEGRTANSACCRCGGEDFNWTVASQPAATSSTSSCCNDRSLKRCPADRPIMCNARACEGDHCCARDISGCSSEGWGGPRICGNVNNWWAIGDKVSTKDEPERCGTLIHVAAGSLQVRPYRIQYDLEASGELKDGDDDDDDLSPWLHEADLERNAACSGEELASEDTSSFLEDDDDDEDDHCRRRRRRGRGGQVTSALVLIPSGRF